MSRIRIYELAKEAGIESKALAEKLIQLGYDIKSHSSTVSDEVANEIRKKIIGTAKTEVVRKRISRKGGATVIRRRARTVHQEPDIVVTPSDEETNDTIKEVEETPEVELKNGMKEEPADAKPAAATKRKKVAEKESKKTEEIEAEESIREPAEEPIPIAEPMEASAEPAQVEEKTAEPEQPPEETAAAAVVEDEAKPKPAEKVKPLSSRKGLAKVIKKAAIHIPEEPAKPSRPAKAAKPFRAKGKMTDAASKPASPGNSGKEKAGKRKGKRFVQIQPEVESSDRFKKSTIGKRRGRKGVAFDDDLEINRRTSSKARKKEKPQTQTVVTETKAIKKRIKVFETISVADIAHRMGIKVNQVISKLMALGVMATVNQPLDLDAAMLVAADFGYEVEQGITEEINVIHLEEQEGGGKLLPRPPVVTVMGHVDHGKTSILDAIRKTDVAAGEAGGITQHIGAYHVRANTGDVVFLDTPGHEAFTEMRSRGAQVTDVVVLVVAADDGVMDQTKEAINHAQAAQVPIVVAVNKIDKPNANPDRVKRELAELGLVPEEWGGETIYCETSAKQHIGIDNLLNNIQLQAEVLELKADPLRLARGRVVEAQLHKGRGAVATILVQDGTLKPGAPFVIGQYYGKVRSLLNDRGEIIKEAGPSTPVEVQGLSGVPLAGDEFVVVTSEKMAKNVSSHRQHKVRETGLASITKISLDKLFEKMQEGEVKELHVILRADVQGTLEAFGKAIENLSTDAIKVRVLHEGTGTITDSDVLLASASDAIIIGFNVRPSVKIKELADKEKVDLRFYDVIYHALDDIRKAMTGLLEPTYQERVIGSAEVRETFHVPKIGTIAGCFVIDGKVVRNANARILRDGVVTYTGKIGSLRRFKDDAKEVLNGYECGIGIENFNDIKVSDIIEVYVVDEVESTL